MKNVKCKIIKKQGCRLSVFCYSLFTCPRLAGANDYSLPLRYSLFTKSNMCYKVKHDKGSGTVPESR